jgi:hypothetical protein
LLSGFWYSTSKWKDGKLWSQFSEYGNSKFSYSHFDFADNNIDKVIKLSPSKQQDWLDLNKMIWQRVVTPCKIHYNYNNEILRI